MQKFHCKNHKSLQKFSSSIVVVSERKWQMWKWRVVDNMNSMLQKLSVHNHNQLLFVFSKFKKKKMHRWWQPMVSPSKHLFNEISSILFFLSYCGIKIKCTIIFSVFFRCVNSNRDDITFKICFLYTRHVILWNVNGTNAPEHISFCNIRVFFLFIDTLTKKKEKEK